MKASLNMNFYENAKVYHGKPVLTARYQPGMENGWAVFFTYKAYEGFRVFEHREEAAQFCAEKPLQEYRLFGESHVVECEYSEPVPVLYSMRNQQNMGNDYTYPAMNIFVSDESAEYEVAFLEEGIWIVKETDGNVRLWDENSKEAFFERNPRKNE